MSVKEQVVWQHYVITRKRREQRQAQKGCCVWFTGLSGSGKSTLANQVEQMLFAQGCRTYLLDGDNLRSGISSDLTFNKVDRRLHIQRIAHVAHLMVDAGLIVLVALISPYRADRQWVRQLFEKDDYKEVFVDTPLPVCEERDHKGLYRKARAGLIKQMTGIDDPYEVPEKPDFHITNDCSLSVAVKMIVEDLL